MKNHVAVFTYGTLMSGEGNNATMQRAGGVLYGEAYADGLRLYDLGPFPGAIEEPGATCRGEVWLVPLGEGLAHLDRLEGVPTLYRRVRRLVRIPGRAVDAPRIFEAFVYVYNGNPARAFGPVHRGDWRAHVAQRFAARFDRPADEVQS